jgi:hypothetical protein
MSDLFNTLMSGGESAPASSMPAADVSAPAPTPTPDLTATAPAPSAPAPGAAAPALAPEPATWTPAIPATPPTDPNAPQAQPAAPVVPPEFATAREFYQKIEPIAARIGGVEHIENAVEWTAMMFGLGDTQGMAPEKYFVEKFRATDPQMYSAIAAEIIERQKPGILQAYRDEILSSIGITPDQLPKVQDFLKYGSGAIGSEEEREFVQELNDSELAKVFTGLTPAHRAHLLNGMPKEMAKDWLADKKAMLDIQSEKSQQQEQKTAFEQQQVQAQTEALRESQISKAEEVFINAKASELGLPKEQITDWLTVIAVQMDKEVGQAERQLRQQYPHATPEQISQALLQQNEVARTWHLLNEACKSRNEIRINAAMNQFRLLTETRWANFLATRQTASPAPVPVAPPAPGAPPVPQFAPGNPPTTNTKGTGLTRMLFGEITPEQYA